MFTIGTIERKVKKSNKPKLITVQLPAELHQKLEAAKIRSGHTNQTLVTAMIAHCLSDLDKVQG